MQFGGALAVTLMPRAGALGVVTLRLVVAAIVLLVVCRPRLRGHSRADWGTVVVFGITMAAMNGLFYQSVARIPWAPPSRSRCSARSRSPSSSPAAP